jgi:hypothetical protein
VGELAPMPAPEAIAYLVRLNGFWPLLTTLRTWAHETDLMLPSSRSSPSRRACHRPPVRRGECVVSLHTLRAPPTA